MLSSGSSTLGVCTTSRLGSSPCTKQWHLFVWPAMMMLSRSQLLAHSAPHIYPPSILPLKASILPCCRPPSDVRVTPALHHAPSESVQGTALPVAGHSHLLHQVCGVTRGVNIVGSGAPNRRTQSGYHPSGQSTRARWVDFCCGVRLQELVCGVWVPVWLVSSEIA